MLTTEPVMAAYKRDLAYIHDVGFGAFAKDSAPGLLKILRGCGTRGLVVDLGCGTGLWAKELSRAGYDVMGIDISAAMIDIARKRVPSAEFRKASYLHLKLPSCNAVTSIGECFNYRFDQNNNRRELFRLFEHIHSALHRGGMLVFDVAVSGRGADGPKRTYFEGDDWSLLVEVKENARRKRLTRRITSFRKVGKFYRRSEEVHQLLLYDPRDIAGKLRHLGFQVRRIRAYGEQCFPRAIVGFVARKA